MTERPTLAAATRLALGDFNQFSRIIIGVPLRPYQLEPAAAILDSIFHQRGMTFVVEMSRQAGKNELSAQIEAYLLTLYQRVGGCIVKASPTFKPQTVNSIRRLRDRLNSPWHKGRTRSSHGYIVEHGRAAVAFFSAEPHASTVGATASLLAEGDEAQDISAQKWQKDFEPMRASTNATEVLWGTAWTSTTMLAQTKADCLQQQQRDGRRRVFLYDADQVAAHVPPYAAHVAGQVAKLGREHPLIKTQYYLEDIDEQSGLFPPARRSLLRGTHERTRAPEPNHVYHVIIDVAGEDENAEATGADRGEMVNPKRDATTLTVVEEIQPELSREPVYLIRDQHLWIGVKHTALYERITGLVDHWHARYIVVDATGIGAGLCSFLEKRFPNRTLRFEFSANTKSDLGWDVIALIETGRLKMYADDQSNESRQFWYEVEKCAMKVHEGPGHRVSWGVTESPAYDGVIARGHDDLLIGAALTAVIDKQPKATYFTAQISAPEPLFEKRRQGRF